MEREHIANEPTPEPTNNSDVHDERELQALLRRLARTIVYCDARATPLARSA